MHILITNDDGIYAPGICSLVNHLLPLGRITVAAPSTEKSATSHAITVYEPIMTKKIQRFHETVQAYAISGTPADCIKLALDSIMEGERPDLVVSGINNGPNLGTDVIYSGTVSGAMEAAMHGVPSLAVSMTERQAENYDEAASFVSRIVPYVMQQPSAPNTVYNINYPAGSSARIKGTRITKLGIRKYRNNFVSREDPRGDRYYWMSGEPVEMPQDPQSDITAAQQGYVSVTPLHYDLTHHTVLEEIRTWGKKVGEMK